MLRPIGWQKLQRESISLAVVLFVVNIFKEVAGGRKGLFVRGGNADW